MKEEDRKLTGEECEGERERVNGGEQQGEKYRKA